MKHMRQIVALLLAVTMLVSFAACGDTPAASTTDPTTTEEPTVTTTDKQNVTDTTTEAPATETTTEAPATETTTEAPVTPTVDPTKVFDADKIVLSFGAISDTQHKYSGIDTLGKFKIALRQLISYADETAGGLDAIVFAGDLVQTATTKEVQEFKGAYEEVIDVTEIPLIFALGNHDVNCHAGYTYEDLTSESFYTIFGDAYRTYDEATSRVDIGCTHTVINNYHFICVNPIDDSYIGYDDAGALYTDEVKAWLDSTLATITAENPDHFVFVNTHPMIYDTTYGSTLLTGNHRWYTKDLTPILEKYNQVVTFGGHVHFPLNDPRSIMQDAFTSMGCASVTYMAIENGGYEEMSSATVMRDCAEYSQGLLVQVDENGNMRITRMDFYNNDTIGEDWVVSHPTADGSHLTAYGKDRGSDENNTAPVLTDIKAVYEDLTTGTNKRVSIKFAAAEDDEFAHHYAMTVTRKSDGRVLKDIKILADFYRHADPADMKKEFTYVIGSLKVGTECEVTLTAYDSWDAVSNTLVYTFTVGEDGGEVGTEEKPEATPVEVYVDFDFAGGKVVDTKGHVSIQNSASAQKATVTHKGTTATVDALVVTSSGQHALCTFDELKGASDVNKFAEDCFTVEAFYVMGQKGSIQGVVCGTQAGGWGLAEDKTGKPYFITGTTGSAYNDSVYAKQTSSKTELVHIVAVYDYKANTQSIYVNGVLEDTKSLKGGFCAGAGSSYNKFSLGNDVTTEGVGGDFPTPAMTMVDAKIYKGAMSAAEAKTAYDNAVAALK